MKLMKREKWCRLSTWTGVRMLIGFLCALAISPAFAQEDIDSVIIRTALDGNEIPKAVRLARDLTVKQPDDGKGWLLYADALERSGEMDDALAAAKKAERLVTVNADKAETYRIIGDIYNAQGRADDSRLAYNSELEMSKASPNVGEEAKARSNIATLDFQDGLFDKAITGFDSCLDLDKSNISGRAKIRANKALVYSKQEKYNEALSTVEEALDEIRKSSNPNLRVLAQVLITKGEILTDAQRYKDAEKALMDGMTQIRKSHDHLGEAYGFKALGDLVLTQGNRVQARERYKQALSTAADLGVPALKDKLELRLIALQDAETLRTFGAIDIGSKGVKGVLMDYFQANGKPQLLQITSSTENTNLLATITPDNHFSHAAMVETAAAVVKISKKLRDVRSGVKIYSITVAGSSALARGVNREELRNLINEEITKMDVGNETNVNKTLRPTLMTPKSFIDTATELRLGILGAIPIEKYAVSVLLDIGSGNGRMGYLSESALTNIEIPLGTVALTAAAKKLQTPNISYEVALEKAVTLVADRLHTSLSTKPSIRQRKEFYLVGGAAWAMTTFLHPQSSLDAYVELQSGDLDKFYDLMKKNSVTPVVPDLSGIRDAKTRDKAASEIDSVRNVFTPENLMAAALLLKTVAESGAITNQHLYFSRFGNWSLGLAQLEYAKSSVH